MKKSILIIAIILVVVLIIGGAIFFLNQEQKPVVEISTPENLETIIKQVYEKADVPLESLATNIVDVTDSESVRFYTGLQSNANVEQVVVSEPMMSSQAYSFVLVKVSEEADVEAMKKEMLDNIDTRKWLCVEAEKVYVTNHADLICLVMSNEQLARSVYISFVDIVEQKIGEELERTSRTEALPEDMLPGQELPGATESEELTDIEGNDEDLENEGLPGAQQPAL